MDNERLGRPYQSITVSTSTVFAENSSGIILTYAEAPQHLEDTPIGMDMDMASLRHLQLRSILIQAATLRHLDIVARIESTPLIPFRMEETLAT